MKIEKKIQYKNQTSENLQKIIEKLENPARKWSQTKLKKTKTIRNPCQKWSHRLHPIVLKIEMVKK